MSASLALIGCADNGPLETLNADKIQISGIYLGMSDTDVINFLGEPDSRESSIAHDRLGLSYPGLYVDLWESAPRPDNTNVVSGLWASSPDHCFRDAVCPGKTLISIQEILGFTKIEPETRDKPKRLIYELPELETCWLWVYTQDSRTASDVRIACQP